MNIIQDDINKIIDGVGIPLMDLEGKKIFISGGSGFLGSWFIAVFQHLNKHVFLKPCLVYSMDSGIATDRKNHIVKIEDKNIIFNNDDISTAVLEFKDITFDYIIHAAGIASPIYYRKYPIETIDGMVLGLSNLLKYAVNNPTTSILYFSSSERYGNPHPEEIPMKETYSGNVSPIGPRSCYDESKRMGEAMCVAYHRIHNLPVKWVMPFNVYGPGMRIVDDRVVPKFTFQLLQDQDITVHLPSLQTRTFCYITDAMIGFFKTLLIGKNGEGYNIGQQAGEMTIAALANKMVKMFETKSKIIKVPMPTEYPQDQAQRRCPNISKAREQLNYFPVVDLDEGLKRTYHWAKEELARNGK